MKVEQLSEDLIRQLSFTAQGNIISLTAFMGGFFAQEVIKSVSGKFVPLDQWVHTNQLIYFFHNVDACFCFRCRCCNGVSFNNLELMTFI